MFVFLIVFMFSLLLQLSLSQVRNNEILSPMMDRGNDVQALSEYLSKLEEINHYLASYRWDYGDLSELLMKKNEFVNYSDSKLKTFEYLKNNFGEEEYVLFEAMITTTKSFSDLFEQIVNLQLIGSTPAATNLYYEKMKDCGIFLAQYARELLEGLIDNSSNLYIKLGLLNDYLEKLQTLAIIAMTFFGCFVVHDFIQIISSMDLFSKSAKAISEGNLDCPDVEIKGSAEIENLAVVFNEMKRSMKNLVNVLEDKHKMEIELKEKENEAIEFESILEREQLQKLRSQINPHFLFNTLNLTIYSSRQEKAVKTERLLISLSNLFRYSLASNDFYAPLSSEIKIVNEYYILYHERFGDRLLLRWHIDDELDVTETFVPSFILQPLVENNFKHGILPLEQGGCVDIYVEPFERGIKIIVHDNGVGMSSDELMLIENRISEHSASGEHLGLYNVAARLRLGDNGSMSVKSELNKGTDIELIIKNTEAKNV